MYIAGEARAYFEADLNYHVDLSSPIRLEHLQIAVFHDTFSAAPTGAVLQPFAESDILVFDLGSTTMLIAEEFTTTRAARSRVNSLVLQYSVTHDIYAVADLLQALVGSVDMFSLGSFSVLHYRPDMEPSSFNSLLSEDARHINKFVLSLHELFCTTYGLPEDDPGASLSL